MVSPVTCPLPSRNSSGQKAMLVHAAAPLAGE